VGEGAAASEGYAASVDPDVLTAFVDARRFQGTMWGFLCAQGRPDPGLDATLDQYRQQHDS
jgi:hypothetical protein